MMRKSGKLFWILLCGLALNLTAQEVKYVLYFIGDGMGPNQVELARLANEGQLNMLTLPVAGQLITHNAEGTVTDSAAAGTALACGTKTTNGVLGLDPNGKRLESVAEEAKSEGWKVGILTSVNPNHATPAAFYAKVGGRGEVDSITDFIIPANFDLIGGAPLLASSDEARAAKVAALEQAGYRTVRTPAEIAALKFGEKARWEAKDVYHIDGESIQLPEVTEAAIAFLAQNNSPFFLMVEGGKIDYASHANDAAAMVNELIEFDRAVGKGIAFAQAHPQETLLIVTADHETGGLQLDPAKFQQADPAAVQDWKARRGAKPDEVQWGIGWTTGGHSNANVPLRAMGPGSAELGRIQENTEVADVIEDAID